jgi:hypothetical protein
MNLIDQLITDFSASIKAGKIKLIIENLRSHSPGLIFDNPYNQALKQTLIINSPEEMFHPEKVHQRLYADAVVSGFLIWNDCEDEAHSLAQNITIPEGSYLHAIIHRREPDIWNSGYWFKKVGNHPVYSLVYDFVSQNYTEEIKDMILIGDEWDPEIFNKLVEKAQNGEHTFHHELAEIQHAELLFLIAHSYRHSIGS